MASFLSSTFARYSCVLFLLLICHENEILGVAAPPPPRKKVAVEGVVYCNMCTRNPNNSFHHENFLAPLDGAVVKLQCNNTKPGWEQQIKTGGQGEFMVTPSKVSTWGIRKCKLFLVSSPRDDCFSPRRSDGPWNLGFPLTAVATSNNTNSSPDIQHFTASQPLLYYYDWPDCV